MRIGIRGAAPVLVMARAAAPVMARVAALIIVMLAASTAVPPPADAQHSREAPEPSTGRAAKKLATGKRYMVAAANPHAVRVGVEILEAGGSAVDAAIAIQMILNLVEPQSSGIGGGAFLVYWNGPEKRITTYDGRETAPAAARTGLFDRHLDDKGRMRDFRAAVRSGAAVGVPGLVAMLALAHKRHGKLPWARLLRPAIRLSREGFRVSPRLHRLIAAVPTLKRHRAARGYFFTSDGRPLPVGYRRRNAAFAATLSALARNGPRWFYRGPIAREIVAAVRRAPGAPGRMTLEDLARYQAVERPAVCGSYRKHRVCGMGPPSSGAIALLQMLGQLERFDLSKHRPTSVEVAHLIAETGRLAFADRNRWVGDPAYVRVPVRAMIDPKYLEGRSALIQPGRALKRGRPGRLPGIRGAVPPAGPALELPSTSHFVVVDGQGNIVSMTSTIENAFGSQIMVGGFLLNNELTDFSFRDRVNGRRVANRVEGGKRPRSSMTPTIIFRPDGSPLLGIGSPGGSSIIGYVLRAVTGVIDWRLPLDKAVALPHVVNRNGPTDLEAGTDAAKLAEALRKQGHKVRIRPMTSGLHGVYFRTDGSLVGAADPRREGLAAGK